MDLDAETMRAVREAVGDEEALASKNLRERGASRAVRHTWWGGVREEDAERQKFQRAGRIGLKTTQALKALKSSKRLLHPVEYENILLAEEAAGGAYSQWGGEEA